MSHAATEVALSHEQINTAIKSREHLKVWLDATGRRWFVFNGMELVDALPWPAGIEAFMQVVMAYRDHRRAIDSGRSEQMEDPTSGELVDVLVPKDEELEVEELDRAIRYLVAQLREKMPEWSLEQAPL